MHVLLRLLSSVGPKSSVPDTIFATVGALANALEGDFVKYMDAFVPFLYNALNNQDEPSLCSMAIGLVSDITRSLGELAQPYCDSFMNSLLHNLGVCNCSDSQMFKCLPYVEYRIEQSIQACDLAVLWRHRASYWSSL